MELQQVQPVQLLAVYVPLESILPQLEQQVHRLAALVLLERTPSQERVRARCVLRVPTTRTRRLPPSPLAQHVLRALTAPASAPPPMRRAWRAQPAPTMIGLDPRQSPHARSVLQARTTPTLGPHRVPLVQRAQLGRTTTMWAPRLRGDARYE